mmetsp:Transcript_48035/g.128816  ORF Transcript_48035/g.128816 Transcript_48035/m.128816 type:complete len:80 (+) Transcript_48035:128-367(+)
MGLSLGPPIGTCLYLAGGFAMPFLVAGSTILFFAPFTLMFHEALPAVDGLHGGGHGGAVTPSLPVRPLHRIARAPHGLG